ncbi:MAG TPA: FAD-dependent monooxygenase [Acidobacteriaceae bacterium]|nr:FAD-dependent monooxygenase [Acidobacteriaceae bacterium]
MTTPDAEVLIAGAGPTGLVLALWLARRGVRVRIVDKNREPVAHSRALAVQARTLEFYAQLGFAQELVEHGHQVPAINLWVSGKQVAHAPFGDFGRDLSAFPYALIFPQDEHEPLLIRHLAEAGVNVERSTELLSFVQDADQVVARLRLRDGTEQTCRAGFLAGCDGARSVVRQGLRIGFPGGEYTHLFYVADVVAGGAVGNGELHVALDHTDFLAIFPLDSHGRMRFVGTIRDEMVNEKEADAQPQLSWNDVSKRVLNWIHADVQRVNWFSTYRVHHRVAEHFREGRVFLLGDAAHIHSPVGGQGMNTGIGDAVNLGWKLAAALRGRAPATILDTFEPERIAFAQRLVATTDQAFTAVTSNGDLARLVRLHIVPYLIPALFSANRSRRFMFRTVSQIAINYRSSDLSEGRTGKLHAGDRLPWVKLSDEADNFAPLTSLDWQVHYYGNALCPDIRRLCTQRGLALHTFAWQAQFAEQGLRENAAYLIRPDGYVALADPAAKARTLAEFLDSHGLTFG